MSVESLNPPWLVVCRRTCRRLPKEAQRRYQQPLVVICLTSDQWVPAVRVGGRSRHSGHATPVFRRPRASLARLGLCNRSADAVPLRHRTRDSETGCAASGALGDLSACETAGAVGLDTWLGR